MAKMKRSIAMVMNPLIIAGVLLGGLGVFVVFKVFSFHSTGTYNVGPFHGDVQARSWVPPWVGAIAIVGGVLLVIAGARRKG